MNYLKKESCLNPQQQLKKIKNKKIVIINKHQYLFLFFSTLGVQDNYNCFYPMLVSPYDGNEQLLFILLLTFRKTFHFHNPLKTIAINLFKWVLSALIVYKNFFVCTHYWYKIHVKFSEQLRCYNTVFMVPIEHRSKVKSFVIYPPFFFTQHECHCRWPSYPLLQSPYLYVCSHRIIILYAHNPL